MDKKALLVELIIKFIFALISVLAIIFIIVNTLSMVNYIITPTIQMLVKTKFGKMLLEVGAIRNLSFKNLLLIFTSFVDKLDFVCYVFLGLQIILFVISFIFIRWRLILNYNLLSIFLGLLYILKYLLMAFDYSRLYGLVYTSDILYSSIAFVVISLVEVLICGVFIIKFILNIKQDLNNLTEE